MKRYLALAILSTLILLSFLCKKKINLEAQEKKGVQPTVTHFWGDNSKEASKTQVGKQYLVLIAISNYRHWGPLEHPVRDAREIREILESRYYIDKVMELYDPNATYAKIVRLFKRLQKELKIDDSLLIFYSGHGHLDEASGNGFWIPVDGGMDEDAQANWLPNAIITGLINNIEAKHIFLISDSCFSGKLVLKGKPDKIDNRYLNEAYKKSCRLVLTAGDKLDKVQDDSEFARQLKLTLRNNNKTYLDSFMIYNGIRESMEDSFPMFAPIKGVAHQEGATFILFLKDKSKSEINENEKIIPPPSIPEFDLDDLKTKAKWAEYQEKFRKSVKEVKDFEKKPNIPDNLKKEAWQRIIEAFKQDNPFSTEDEELRELAGKRVEYWGRNPVLITLEELNDKIKEKNPQGYWEADIDGHTMIYLPNLKIVVDKYEVSYALYEEKMKNKGKNAKIPLIKMLKEKHPAIVTYEEALQYCNWNKMRLLTDEEWQWVAGRQKGNLYSWGEEEVVNDSIYRANYKSLDDGNVLIAPVKSYEDFASPYGLVNLSGNVWEWVQGKKCKGGGFLSPKEDLEIKRSAEGKEFVGFRCVKDVEQ